MSKPRNKMVRKDYENLIGVKKRKVKHKKIKQKGGQRLKKAKRNKITPNPIHITSLLNMTPHFNKNSGQRKKLIEDLSPAQFLALKKICKRFLQGKFPVSTKLLQKLFPVKKDIYKVAEAKKIGEAKHFLNQKGGFAGALIPLALSIVPDLLSSILKI